MLKRSSFSLVSKHGIWNQSLTDWVSSCFPAVFLHARPRDLNGNRLKYWEGECCNGLRQCLVTALMNCFQCTCRTQDFPHHHIWSHTFILRTLSLLLPKRQYVFGTPSRMNGDEVSTCRACCGNGFWFILEGCHFIKRNAFGNIEKKKKLLSQSNCQKENVDIN